MKPIQVMFDEPLLERLDADEDVRKLGRSEVLRRAAAEYLRGRRARSTTDAYRRAYGKRGGLGAEYDGWSDEGSWPERAPAATPARKRVNARVRGVNERERGRARAKC